MKKPKNHRQKNAPQLELFAPKARKGPTIAEMNARYGAHLMRRKEPGK